MSLVSYIIYLLFKITFVISFHNIIVVIPIHAIFLTFIGISGPRGRPGKAGKDGNHGIPGVNLWKIKVNGTYSNEMLIPPSIASKHSKYQWETISVVNLFYNLFSTSN